VNSQNTGNSAQFIAPAELSHICGDERESPLGAAWGRETLPRALRRCAAQWGDKELLVFPERRATAAQFLEEVERFALGLKQLGFGPGDRLAVWLPNTLESVVAEMAVAALGGSLVFINTRYKTHEFEYVLRQSDASALLLPREFLQIDFLAMLREVCPEAAQAKKGSVASGAFPCLKKIIVAGSAPDEFVAYEEVLRIGASTGRREDLERMETSVQPEDVVILQYTSGTTAFPKAVMLSHGQVLRNAYQMAERANIGAEDRVLSAMPMFHVGGSVCALLGAVTRGYTLYTSATFDAGETIRLLEAERITTYIGLESMFIALRNHEAFEKHSRASLSKGWSAGTPAVLRMVVEEIGIRHLCPLYGLSEGSPNVCIADWRDPQEKRVSTMGRPEPGVEVKIIEPASGATLRRGESGEICVRGWNVMKGYYKKPEETAAATDEEGWLHTGDLGRIDADGYLIWKGRLKDMLRVGGENVSAVEVENFLCGHPAVRAAAVVGVPDERLREVPLAFVQLKAGASLTEAELIDYCKPRIAGFKVPRHVRIVAEFEMTGSGKIQKYVMRDRILREFEKAEPS
jgi:fatty-acyl-CoA synthase